MGTYATVVVRGTGDAEGTRAAETTRAVFDRVEATMSNWSPASELSRLNREAGRGPYRIDDPGLASCVEAALRGAEETGGAFDPTVGPLMTLWGFRPKAPRVPAAHAPDETKPLRFARSAGDGHGDAEQRICPELALELRADHPKQHMVNMLLHRGFLADEGWSDGFPTDREVARGFARLEIAAPCARTNHGVEWRGDPPRKRPIRKESPHDRSIPAHARLHRRARAIGRAVPAGRAACRT